MNLEATDQPERSTPREWDAGSYHRVANPHVDWGTVVLARLPLEGHETVIDLGCGTGRMTERVLQRLPGGKVIAVDGSANMIEGTRAFLEPQFPGQIEYIVSDLLALDLVDVADVVFSTATFHWIPEHPRLFAIIFRALHPGGQLLAQCGGRPNLEDLINRANAILAEPPFREHIGNWPGPWTFANAAETAERLRDAGFTDVSTEVIPAPVTLESEDAYRDFLTTVVFGSHVARLPDHGMRTAFIDRLVAQSEADPVPFHLDYWRLNMTATKPG